MCLPRLFLSCAACVRLTHGPEQGFLPAAAPRGGGASLGFARCELLRAVTRLDQKGEEGDSRRRAQALLRLSVLPRCLLCSVPLLLPSFCGSPLLSLPFRLLLMCVLFTSADFCTTHALWGSASRGRCCCWNIRVASGQSLASSRCCQNALQHKVKPFSEVVLLEL